LNRSNHYDEVFLQSVNLKPGDKIKVTKGVFVNLEGNVIALNGKQVQIYIPSLRIALVAIATDNVAVISA
jgi:transcription antitermination factor NusG